MVLIVFCKCSFWRHLEDTRADANLAPFASLQANLMQSPSDLLPGGSPYIMALSIREAVYIVALALLATATITNGQLDSTKSYFLLTGQVEGSVTLSSLTAAVSHYPLPAYSQEIAIQALTDVVNGRFLVLSGQSLGAQGVNYTVRLQTSFWPTSTLQWNVCENASVSKALNCLRIRK